jgi:hypothetical protein
MVPPRLFRRLGGGLLLALGLCSALIPTAPAQDRSVPRFGPLVAPDTVQAGPSDFGRLWSVAAPPLDHVEETYDVRANERGLRHLRLGTVRLPDCSGAVVSPQGLVLTAARCVRSFLPTGKGDSLRMEAFVAAEQEDERALDGLYAERVVGVETVTAQVERDGRDAVQARLQEGAGANERVEIVPEAGGSRQVAYTYRRYEDVRLAFSPDRAVTTRGRLGQPLTYPQHAWDVAVLRIYADDSPLQTPEHLDVRTSGARPGDAVFAVGHPAETHRVETHHQLALRRDLQLPARLSTVNAWTEALHRYVDTTAQAGRWADRLAVARTTRHRLRAQLESLQSNYVMARLRARDRALQRSAAQGAAGLIDSLAVLQPEKRAHADPYRALSFLRHPDYSSATLRRAVRYAQASTGEERSSSALQEALAAVPDQPPALDAALLADHLARVRKHLGGDTALTRILEQVGPPDSLVRTSVFADSAQLQARLRADDLPDDDPVRRLGAALADRYNDFQETWGALAEREAPLADSLARVRHRLSGRPAALPQDRALRVSDGRIQGYPYNGTLAPPFTTFYGLYGRHHARSANGPELPARWQTPVPPLERSTPLATVSSTDLGGGAHGGPLLTTSLELVGVVFDGNVQSAAAEYLFLPKRMRTVAVDVRGVIEGLSAVYEGERLVQEMTTDASAP